MAHNRYLLGTKNPTPLLFPVPITNRKWECCTKTENCYSTTFRTSLAYSLSPLSSNYSSSYYPSSSALPSSPTVRPSYTSTTESQASPILTPCSSPSGTRPFIRYQPLKLALYNTLQRLNVRHHALIVHYFYSAISYLP